MKFFRDRDGKPISVLKSFFRQQYASPVIEIIVLTIVFSIFTESFMTSFNIFGLSRTSSVYAFIGAAQLIVILIGDINLSIGGCGALCTVLMGTMMQDFGMPTGIAFLAGLLLSVLCGLINGGLIIKTKLSPWIITLSTNFIFTGLAFGYSRGYPYTVPESLTWIGRTTILQWGSVLLVLMTILCICIYISFRYLRLGREILAVGGNRGAARLSGINVEQTVVICYVISCIMAYLAAVLWGCRTGTISPSTGADWTLYSIAVCAIAGIPLTGGVVTALGFFCGGWILSMVRNGLAMLHVDTYYEQVYLGLLILLAVSIESFRTMFSNRSKQ